MALLRRRQGQLTRRSWKGRGRRLIHMLSRIDLKTAKVSWDHGTENRKKTNWY